MSRRLDERSGPWVAEHLTADSMVVVPTGAIEHHGPHLPLATDRIMAEAVAAAAVERAAAAGVDAWLLPSLAYTKSDEHAWAAGTMWLSAETFHATLVDLGRSIAATPARRVVFLNGHGGNVAPLGVALRELRRRFGLQTFLTGIRVPPATATRAATSSAWASTAGTARPRSCCTCGPIWSTCRLRNAPCPSTCSTPR
ncbi:creatininase family protein [Agromyces mangrovi Wang et al. 2018]|uniref:creatininase family protein n=1 Tax=Agromyces mangrovi TaxID=1858653 RepID=UPI0025738EAA|nr:creatininase family protein [Agromyces mangrovi]BDZ63812.1 hypothetical protein GCM10025877_07500 [Agromyces mangrovi]